MKMHTFAKLFAALSLIAISLHATAAPVVDVLDPATLEKLDQPGVFSLATVLGAQDIETRFFTDNQSLESLTRLKVLRLSVLNAGQNPRFSSIAKTIAQDVEDLRRTAGIKMAYSSEQAELLAPQGNVARHFDPHWLTSSETGFPLIAVINRIDKRDFYPGTCGETRFIYRLAYYRAVRANGKLNESRSTLPVFLNVVFDNLDDGRGCKEIANTWSSLPSAPTAQSLLGVALAKPRLRLKQVELNMQIVRFPSRQKEDFGGEAIYLFRIFEEQNGSLVSIPLENTPNVAEVMKSASLKKALADQLTNKANLTKIDDGTFVLENSEGRLLATRALSFSTAGRARLPNKPFTAIFGGEGKGLEGADLALMKFVKSRAGLVERMNNSTCVGCHQNGGTAGFHMLGRTGSLNSTFNQVVLPFSPHYQAEAKRRASYVESLVRTGQAPSFRPPSFYPATAGQNASGTPTFEAAQVRDLCLLDSKSFQPAAQCRAGLTCRATVRNAALGVTIGECVNEAKAIAGHACRVGTITNAPIRSDLGDLFNLLSFNDSMNVEQTFSSGACGHPRGGVPLGRISKTCDLNSREGLLSFVDGLTSFAGVPDEMCAMRGGPQFDECARSKNPPECLANARIARALLDTCYPGRSCREDYICQRLPEAIARDYGPAQRTLVTKRVEKLGQMNIGFCVPNYFIFNMRADGHIIPEGRK